MERNLRKHKVEREAEVVHRDCGSSINVLSMFQVKNILHKFTLLAFFFYENFFF